jgi:RES domain
VADSSKRESLQQRLDQQGFVEAVDYYSRAGQQGVTFLGRQDSRPSLPPLRTLDDTFYRVGEPLCEPLTTPQTVRVDGRFHEAGEAPPLYASSTETAAVGEFWQHLSRLLPGGTAPRLVRSLVTFRTSGLTVVDLTDSATSGAFGTAPDDLRRGSEASRAVAAIVAPVPEVDGLLAPSGAIAGAATLAVFPRAFAKLSVVTAERVTVEGGSISEVAAGLIEPLYSDTEAFDRELATLVAEASAAYR